MQITVTIPKASVDALVDSIVKGVVAKLAQTQNPTPTKEIPEKQVEIVPRKVLDQKSGISIVQAIQQLQIKKGAYKGMFIVAPAGVGNWYFANLGLHGAIPYIDSTALDTLVKPYLDLYISKIRSDYTIDDVGFPGGIDFPEITTLHISDSDDSYGSTFVSLVRAYVEASGDLIWWNANYKTINEIITKNCLAAIKPNNLTSTFIPTNTQKKWDIGYFMDNCEVYRGLRDAAILNKNNDAVSKTFDAGADKIALGLRSLWSVTGFRYADAALTLRTTDKALYPDGACQIFAEAFGVVELNDLFDKSYDYLNVNFPDWETGKLDPFPFAVLGYVSALRKDFARAKIQMNVVEEKFSLSRPNITLNELGWYSRTRAIMA